MPDKQTSIAFHKRTALALLLWLVALAAFGQEAPPSTEVRDLSPNQTLEREMTGAETHRYKFDLKANEFFQVRVEQKGLDVALKLSDASGNALTTMDSPNGNDGPETLSFVAASAGSFVLEVSCFNPQARKGGYTIKREASRTATAKDRRRVEVERLFVEGVAALDRPGEGEIAITKLSAAGAGWEELSDNYMAVQSLATAGDILNMMGAHTKALKYFEQALGISRAIANKYWEATALHNIGRIYEALGEKRKALEAYNQALPLLQAIGDRRNEAATFNIIGLVYEALGERQKALEYYNQALPLLKALGNRPGEATMLNNIGQVYDYLGERQKALEFYNQALPLWKAVGEKRGEAGTLSNIGLVYADLGERQKALEFYNQALLLWKAEGYKGDEATTLTGIGRVYADLGEQQKALEFYNQALPLLQAIGERRSKADALTGIGRVYADLGEQQKALEYFNQALPICKAVGYRSGEATTLDWLQSTWLSLKNPRLAIFYGKQAINKFQELRRAIQGLDKAIQKTYLKTVEPAYRRLSDILIAEGRLLEAEQVLMMLKQEEVFDYLRRDATEADQLQQRADLRPEEREALKRSNEIADQIATLGAEFGALQELQSTGVKLTVEQEKRYDELSAKIEDASRVFQVFLRQLADEFATRPNTEKDLQENLALQADLKSWGEGVVFLYTLVGEDRYRVILITPDTQVDGKYEIKAVDLNDKIEKFRQAVQNPKVDPRPLGKELYDILIKPVEKQLAGARAKTLLWSLDGNLRLLPLAALWDGQQYFGQKYQNVTITLASRTRLGETNTSNWRALGLGVSQGKKVTEPNGTRELAFRALPAVRAELSSIVQSAQSPEGVLPGQSLLDAEFSENAFEAQLLRGYKVIHIASHFSLNPGDSTRSFLLLGDGNVLTVDNIKNNPRLNFRGVELLTLSACQTAVVEKDSSGKEIEGFGYVAQQKGAKAILATLWSVADESTRLLMSEFYRLRKENPQMTKAAALQMAQQEMLSGNLNAPKSTGVRRDTSEADVGASPDYTHPYYWSPFILIGNWR